MKAFLLAVCVLGLAVGFGLCEPEPTSVSAVTSDEVRLVSERIAEQTSSQAMARTRNGKRAGGIAH